MPSIWIVILGFITVAVVLLSVLLTGPPFYPNMFAALFVVAVTGLGFSVMTFRVAEYRATHPEAFGPIKTANEEELRPPQPQFPMRPGMGAAAPQAALKSLHRRSTPTALRWGAVGALYSATCAPDIPKRDANPGG